MLLLSLTLPLLASAFVPEHFGFEWQERILSLGLGDNNVTDTGCAIACDWIHNLLPIPDILPSSQDFWKEKSFYWSSQQAEVSPQCFVQPTSAEDVAAVVVLAKRAKCAFAVKSGGHGAFKGASNIEGGITIDLSLLNEIAVAEDEATTHVGPGNRWIDIYSYLDTKGLSVVGGRVSEIGVGGLVLGGGISFFSGRFGWALDGVRNYELVTADGEILQVNYNSYPDLYWALRGGGNNFGIVTAFDLETFAQGEMWGGMHVATIDHNETLLDAFIHYAHNSPQDFDGAAYTAFVWDKANSMYMASSELVYTRPVEDPAILQNFTAVPNIHSTLRKTHMADLAKEIQSVAVNGFRNSYWTATFQATREMAQIIFDVSMEEIKKIEDVENIVPAIVFQAITTDVIARFSRNGGNCLGIEDGEGPFIVINFAVSWKNESDDELVLSVANNIIDRTTAKAKGIGAYHRYIYQNYADISQDVFGGYGEENLKKLREISLKYDPEQVFQKLQPGYLKLY